jgi:DNA-binding transcriptional ArsR family regulator
MEDTAMTRDPWHFQRWAFATTTGSSGRKAVLMALSSMADSTSGRCEAKVETLVQMTEISDRTVRTHLAALDDAGLIARRPQYRADRGRRGDEFLLLAPGIDEWPDGARARQNSQGGGCEQRHGAHVANCRAGTATRNDHV